MPTYTFTLPDGSTATVEGANSQDEAMAAAMREHDKQTKASVLGPEDTVVPGMHFGRAAQTLGDVVGAVIHGGSMHMDDKVAAGINSATNWLGSKVGLSDPYPYDQALAEQALNSRDRTTRLNAVNPGSSTALDVLGAAATPLKVAKFIPGEGALARIGAYGAEGAAQGAASAWGDDQNPLEGAGFGLVTGAGLPALAYGLRGASSYLPDAASTGIKTGAAAVGSWLGSKSPILPGTAARAGERLGWRLGSKVASPLVSGMQAAGGPINALTQTDTARDALAQLATLPARQYGPLKNWWDGNNY